MTSEEIARFFNNARPHIQGNPNLRDPQVEGWFRTRQHFLTATAFRRTEEDLGEPCGKVTAAHQLQDHVADRLKNIIPALIKPAGQVCEGKRRYT
jgi:hypothetical protein